VTNAQFYFAIGVPTVLFALNFLAVLWQARGLERTVRTEISSLRDVMIAKFEVVDAKFESTRQGLLRVEGVLDARLKHLEERVK
jgi:hypothetical protein